MLVAAAMLPAQAQARDGLQALRSAADAAMLPGGPVEWNVEQGLLLDGMDAAWYGTADGRYYRYVQQSMDTFVGADGTLHLQEPDAPSAASALLGQQLVLLYRVTQDARYYKAATQMRQLVAKRWAEFAPEASGMDQAAEFLMAQVFFAEYAAAFDGPQEFANITRALTQRMPHGLEREPGWYMMALVDSLPYYPPREPGRRQLIAVLNQQAARAAGVGPSPKDGGESSAAACRLVYALAKGVRLGYLTQKYAQIAERKWKEIEDHSGSGAPARMRVGQQHGAGAYLLAASEMAMEPSSSMGRGKKVLLDAWFNSQKRKNAAGKLKYFHYKWDDYSNSGSSLFGHMLRSYGMTTDTLYTAPTAENLKGAQWYIIVSPDNTARNPNPLYMNAQDAQQVQAWVKRGGVLLLMENDPANADISHLDILADAFGLHFNNLLTHHVVGDNFAMGRIDVPEVTPPFTHPHVLYMKDTCSLALTKGATPLLRYKGDVLMAVAKYGKGKVFAVADPWLYNEYTDGRKLPPEFDNFAAGEELVRWLLQ